MPILYPISCAAMAFAFWFNKIMLMRYYQQTYEFNEELPMLSMKILKFGVLIHFAVGLFTLSNFDILEETDNHESHFYFWDEYDKA